MKTNTLLALWRPLALAVFAVANTASCRCPVDHCACAAFPNQWVHSAGRYNRGCIRTTQSLGEKFVAFEEGQQTSRTITLRLEFVVLAVGVL